MKINVNQLDEKTRNTIALAIEIYGSKFSEHFPDIQEKYTNMATRIRHGELLLCEYQYNGKEE